MRQKEPKLSRARQIPEWEEYDSEIARFARTLADKGLVRSNVAAVDVNALAGEAVRTESQPERKDGSEGMVSIPDTHEVEESKSGANDAAAKSHTRDEL